ncbi:hypothetical protein [Sphingomonas sp. Ant20]|uniref:hypothetical protein n=1 Tax=Sphingomonas sp. Ant20 TaxID=104605 RepID=UPI000537403A|nr:hypothetical protein [Sphingomonas sp. Ant20]KHA63420.1 hypothetical protein NI18_16030 [Sphingomonas sp. Ant20]
MTRTCLDCTTPVTRQSKTGRCRSCAARHNHRDPAFVARLHAASATGKRTPEARAKARESTLRREAERKDDPAWRAYKVAAGKRLRALYDSSSDARAANLAKRAIVGEKNSRRTLGWLPDRLRREYESARTMFGAAEAKRIMMTELTPFERQMARIAGGAQLVAAPDTRTGGPAYTLGGISSGML